MLCQYCSCNTGPPSQVTWTGMTHVPPPLLRQTWSTTFSRPGDGGQWMFSQQVAVIVRLKWLITDSGKQTAVYTVSVVAFLLMTGLPSVFRLQQYPAVRPGIMATWSARDETYYYQNVQVFHVIMACVWYYACWQWQSLQSSLCWAQWSSAAQQQSVWWPSLIYQLLLTAAMTLRTVWLRG